MGSPSNEQNIKQIYGAIFFDVVCSNGSNLTHFCALFDIFSEYLWKIMIMEISYKIHGKPDPRGVRGCRPPHTPSPQFLWGAPSLKLAGKSIPVDPSRPWVDPVILWNPKTISLPNHHASQTGWKSKGKLGKPLEKQEQERDPGLGVDPGSSPGRPQPKVIRYIYNFFRISVWPSPSKILIR